MRPHPDRAIAHFDRGLALAQAGKLSEAADCLQQAIALRPDFAEAHSLLGAALGAQGKFDLAAVACRNALQANPNLAESHLNLGTVLARQEKLDEAIACFRRALELKPDLAEAYNNLANAAIAQNQLDEAVGCCQRALQLRANFAEAHLTLASALTAQGKLAEAAACCRRAIELRPDFADAHNSLGAILEKEGSLDEAETCCRRALALKPDLADAHNNLAAVLAALGRLDEAVAACQRALEIKPEAADASNNLAAMLAGQGKTDAARQCYAKALRLNPRQVVWRLSMASLCPRIFASNQEIDAYRQALLRELESFAAARHAVEPSQLQASDCKPSFNLQFHGRDDRPIREAYARIFNDCFLEERAIGSPGRPRIGFVVTDRHEKGFVKSMGGILERMDPDLFELVVVGSHRGIPLLRSGIRSEAVRLLGFPATLDQIANAIRQLQFDLLYYWEVGTDNTNYFLPFLRLAPVQCTSWGIQVTSGIAQVDHYLSAALVEPEDAAGHYTENLVLASTLLTYRPRVSAPVPLKGREHFGVASSQHLYLCAQQLGKFHPDFDPLLAGILRQDPKGIVVIVEDLHGAFVAEELRTRFAKTISDVPDRILFLPFQETGDYLSLIAEADVLLDPPHFGGVNTSYDGFSLHKPIVTLPSQFQRGRYTLGCYRKMGISDTVALDPRQYIDIAVALGTDAAFRHHVSQRIERASQVLFEDAQAVHEHERIFRELIEEARSVGPRRP